MVGFWRLGQEDQNSGKHLAAKPKAAPLTIADAASW